MEHLYIPMRVNLALTWGDGLDPRRLGPSCHLRGVQGDFLSLPFPS